MHAGIRWIGGGVLLLVWLAGPAQASVKSELAFHRGVVAYGDERMDEAKTAFETVIAEDPEDVSALHYLGLISQAQSDFPAAIQWYQKGLALDPEDPDLRFDLGSAQLEAGLNQEALATFDEVLAAEPDRPRALLFRGIALYRLGNYDAAVPSFDRAIALDPALKVHARYYTGLSEAMRGNLGTAAGAFDDVTDASPASPLSRSAGSLRDQVKPKESRPWSLGLTAGLEYDSNPLVAGKGIHRKDDGRGVYRIRGSYRLFENEKTNVDLGYDGFFSTHFDETQVDLQTHVGWLSTSYKVMDNVRLSLRYDFAYTFINMSDEFRMLNRWTPSVLVQQSDWGMLQSFFQYQNLEYFVSLPATSPPNALDRDGNEYAFGATQFFFVPAPFRYIRIGALGDFLDTDGTEFGYDAFEVNAGFGAMLPFDIDLTVLYRYIHRYFHDRSIFLPMRHRDEDVNRLTLEAVRQFGDHWELSVGGSFNFHDANVGIYDHNRQIVGSYVTYRF